MQTPSSTNQPPFTQLLPAIHMMSIQAIMCATFPSVVMHLITEWRVLFNHMWTHSNILTFSIQLATVRHQ